MVKIALIIIGLASVASFCVGYYVGCGSELARLSGFIERLRADARMARLDADRFRDMYYRAKSGTHNGVE